MVEREKELELYKLTQKKSQKAKEYKGADCSAESAVNDSDLGNIVNSVQSFVQKVSSYEGAEVPTNKSVTSCCGITYNVFIFFTVNCHSTIVYTIYKYVLCHAHMNTCIMLF
ncbi:hypothetical protein MKX03_023038 [Papaver bracteatum]|nr:hypothetical protein MKX03_023038 [Papaver bracteatum]